MTKAHSTRAQRRAHMLKKYGLDDASYQKMFDNQNGVCLICGCPETKTVHGKVQALSVDHCHFSGKVRALLCHRCNHTLGTTGDNPLLLKRMADYLETKVTYPPVYASLLTQVQKFDRVISDLPMFLQDMALDVFLHKLPQKEIAFKHGKTQPWVSYNMGKILTLIHELLTSLTASKSKTLHRLESSLEEKQAALKDKMEMWYIKRDIRSFVEKK